MPTFRLRRSIGSSALRSSVAGGAPGDTLRYSVVLSPTTSDTLTLTDTNTQRRNVLARPDSDTLTAADTNTRDYDPKRALSETLAEADSITRVVGRARAASDTETLSDTVARRNVLARPNAETTTEGDSLTQTDAPKRALSDALVLSDTQTRDYDPKRAISDTEMTVDTAARSNAQGRSGSTEATVWTDTWTSLRNLKRAISDQWSTGVSPIPERLSPDYIRTAIHYVGPVSYIQDDPDAADANWIVWDGMLGELRVSFPQPAGNPTTGAGLQEFRIRVRPG